MYIDFRVKIYRELNLVRALDEDTRVSPSTSSSPLGQRTVSGTMYIRMYVCTYVRRMTYFI